MIPVSLHASGTALPWPISTSICRSFGRKSPVRSIPTVPDAIQRVQSASVQLVIAATLPSEYVMVPEPD